MQKYDVAIVGGGAAGLACALTLGNSGNNLNVIVVEAGERVGRKMAASGNGQGNISNAEMTPEHFHGGGASIAEKLCCSGMYDHLKLFDFLFTQDKAGRIYPAGRQASALSDCLMRKIQACGVKILLSTKVEKIEKGFVLSLSDGEKISARRVVVAAGGKAQKQFFTDGNGYTLAAPFGHTITPLYPSLVQLKCDTRHIKTLKGIRADCKIRAFDQGGNLLGASSGDVIFTDYGISGNAVFYISSFLAGVENATVSLEFLPEFTEEEIEKDLENKLKAGYGQSELLSGTLHNQLGRAIIKRCESGDKRVIAAAVKNFTLRVTGSLGFDYAQVTKGGLSVDEVDENLQSKLVKGLYFAGEILDVDGDCGGYNLTFALCSGIHVATKICGEINVDD